MHKLVGKSMAKEAEEAANHSGSGHIEGAATAAAIETANVLSSSLTWQLIICSIDTNTIGTNTNLKTFTSQSDRRHMIVIRQIAVH